MTKNDQNDPDQQFFKGCTHDLDKTDEATASSASIVATAMKLMHWDSFKQDTFSTVGGDWGCRAGEVRASTTSPMPAHKGFKLQ